MATLHAPSRTSHLLPKRTQHYPTRQRLLKPFASTFSAPSSCWTPLIDYDSVRYAVTGTCTSGGHSVTDATACYPTVWASAAFGGIQGGDYGSTWPFYYPASVCPSGYTAACSFGPSDVMSPSKYEPSGELYIALQHNQTATVCCAR